LFEGCSPEIKICTELTFQLLKDGILSGNLCPSGKRFGCGGGEGLRDIWGTFKADPKSADQLLDKTQRSWCDL